MPPSGDSAYIPQLLIDVLRSCGKLGGPGRKGVGRVKRYIFVAIALLLFFASISCRKIQEVRKPSGPITYQPAKFADAIPQEYGNLVALSQSPGNWELLWFQKADGTITVVPFNPQQGKLGDQVFTIPRK